MILVCISDITIPHHDSPVHDYGYMIDLPDRSKDNIGFNPEFWRRATDLETQIHANGVRNMLIAIRQLGL